MGENAVRLESVLLKSCLGLAPAEQLPFTQDQVPPQPMPE